MKQQRGTGRSAGRRAGSAAKKSDDERLPTGSLTGDLVRRGRARASRVPAAPQEPDLPRVEDQPAPREDLPRVDFARDPRWLVTWFAVFFIAFIIGLNLIL